jgi:hypothetical protein
LAPWLRSVLSLLKEADSLDAPFSICSSCESSAYVTAKLILSMFGSAVWSRITGILGSLERLVPTLKNQLQAFHGHASETDEQREVINDYM